MCYPNKSQIVLPTKSTLVTYCGVKANIWKISCEVNIDIKYIFRSVLKNITTVIYVNTENDFELGWRVDIFVFWVFYAHAKNSLSQVSSL